MGQEPEWEHVTHATCTPLTAPPPPLPFLPFSLLAVLLCSIHPPNYSSTSAQCIRQVTARTLGTAPRLAAVLSAALKAIVRPPRTAGQAV